jgi:Protein of unknown function (DUF3592)
MVGYATNACTVVRSALLGDRVGQRWIFRSRSGWLGGNRITDFSILWICSALVLMGAVLLVDGGRGSAFAARTTQWSSVVGEVVSVQMEERRAGFDVEWIPHIVYRYAAKGRQIQGTLLVPGAHPHWRNSADADAFLSRYLTRKNVLVYYDHDDPTQSVLEPDSGTMTPAGWVGLLFVVIGLCLWIAYDRMH